MSELQLGRLWGASAGKARVQVRPRNRQAEGALELVLGYEGAAKHRRWTYQPDDAGGGEVGRLLQMSPDDTLIQVPTAWVHWLHEHMGVEWEWCTSWYGMARVKGVTSRVVGKIPHPLISGSVHRAWKTDIGYGDRGSAGALSCGEPCFSAVAAAPSFIDGSLWRRVPKHDRRGAVI